MNLIVINLKYYIYIYIYIYYKKSKIYNYLEGVLVVRTLDQEVCFPVVSGSSSMVANMVVTGGLYDH